MEARLDGMMKTELKEITALKQAKTRLVLNERLERKRNTNFISRLKTVSNKIPAPNFGPLFLYNQLPTWKKGSMNPILLLLLVRERERYSAACLYGR